MEHPVDQSIVPDLLFHRGQIAHIEQHRHIGCVVAVIRILGVELTGTVDHQFLVFQLVQCSVHLSFEFALVYIRQLKKVMLLTLKAVIRGADSIIIPQDLLHFNTGQNRKELILGREIGNMERIVALGIQLEFQLLCGRNHRKIDIGLDVNQPVHGKLLYIGGICRMGDQQNTDAVMYLYIGITAKTIEL